MAGNFRFRKWFHPNLSGVAAEKLLMEHGQDGSFLARPSRTKIGDFTLSVRRGTDVTHIKIQNNGDFFDLYGGEKFATLTELVQFYMERQGQLREVNGRLIELRYPLTSEDPTTERWFHGSICGTYAERMLRERGKGGSFLVRESENLHNSYVLCVLTNERVVQIRIYADESGRFDVGGGKKFDSLVELIEYYRKTPMVDKAGMVVHLKQPFNATRINAATIDQRFKELEKLNGSSESDKAGFWEEFEDLQREAEASQLYPRSDGSKPENRARNRYKNILPFDHSRVQLLSDLRGDLEGGNGTSSDYINANYIQADEEALGCSEWRKRYIATQGTLSNTVVDFWRMAWQENSRVIVLTTKEVERGRNKCVRYWPSGGVVADSLLTTDSMTMTHDNDATNLYLQVHDGHFCIRLLREQPGRDYTLRELELARYNEQGAHYKGEPPRLIYHFHFTVWPDHGVPADPSCVLNFLQDVNARQESTHGPVIVQCSAGIGRTGTFIVIDIIINQINAQGLTCDIDIHRTTQHVRSQRSGMVQTEIQYKFVYKAVRHYIDTITKRIQADQDNRKTGNHDYTNINSAAEDLATVTPAAEVTPLFPSALPASFFNHTNATESEPIPRPRISRKALQPQQPDTTIHSSLIAATLCDSDLSTTLHHPPVPPRKALCHSGNVAGIFTAQ